MARESFQQANTGSAQSKDTRTLSGNKRGRPNMASKSAFLDENKQSLSPILVSAVMREKIEAQLFRLMGKRDPRAIPRIIHDRTGLPEITIEFVIQGIVKEYRIWQREIRSALARADEVSAQMWKRKSA